MLTRSGWRVRNSELALFRAFLAAKTVRGAGFQVALWDLERAFGIYYEFDREPTTFCGVPVEALLEAARIRVFRPYRHGMFVEVIKGFRLVPDALNIPKKKPIGSTL